MELENCTLPSWLSNRRNFFFPEAKGIRENKREWLTSGPLFLLPAVWVEGPFPLLPLVHGWHSRLAILTTVFSILVPQVLFCWLIFYSMASQDSCRVGVLRVASFSTSSMNVFEALNVEYRAWQKWIKDRLPFPGDCNLLGKQVLSK